MTPAMKSARQANSPRAGSSRPEKMPLIPATRPLSKSNRAAPRPRSAPPIKD